MKKVDTFILRLTILAFFMAAAYETIGIAQKMGITPFEFRYRIHGQGNGGTGAVIQIQPEQLKRILDGRPVPKTLVFSTDIFATGAGRVFFHVNRPESTFLAINGQPVPLGTQKFFHPLRLKKGFNRMVIRYSPFKPDPAGLSISLSENAALLRFPFSRLILPGKPLSVPRIVFFLVRFLDFGRTAAFFFSLILIFFRLPRYFFQRQNITPAPSLSFLFLIFQFLINLFCLYNILIFCLNMLRVNVSLTILFWLSGFLDLVILLSAYHHRPIAFRWDHKKTTVFFGVSVLVLLYVFSSTGSFLPLKPIGQGDLGAHLQMIKHIQHQGRFMDEENWRIYPQSIHAVIVMGAKMSGMQPEEFITPFFISMLILFFFSIYLLGSSMIPGIPLFLWFLAFGISQFTFIFQGMLIQSSFPAIVSVSLFLLSLYFYVRRSFPSSSIALAASLAAYPYFAVAFLLGIIIFALWIERPSCFRQWNRLLTGLLPSIGVMGIYLGVFLAHGFLQQKEGLVTAHLLNPFLSLRFWNTALIFLGVVFLFDSKYSKPALGLFSAITLGFLINYLPYALFQATSTYYVMKNMIVLIAVGMIFAAGALTNIYRRWLVPK